MEKTYIGYDPNNLYWVSAKDVNFNNCSTLKNINCNNVDSYSSWQRVSMCYQKELCKNKEYSTLLKSFQTNNSGFDERLSDKKKEYRHDFINSINLGIGVFGLSCYIYLNK